jgi:hypothetical protein
MDRDRERDMDMDRNTDRHTDRDIERFIEHGHGYPHGHRHGHGYGNRDTDERQILTMSHKKSANYSKGGNEIIAKNFMTGKIIVLTETVRMAKTFLVEISSL